MPCLPRGAPALERQPAWKELVPAFLAKWARASFSGYVRYLFEASKTEVVLLFSEGKLITAKCETGPTMTSGLDALNHLCLRATTEDGAVEAFRMTPALITAVNGVLHAELHLRGQELKAIDVQSLAQKIKARRLNGCVRVTAGTRCSLIFYKDGSGTGFFHDGADAIETGATEEQRIATLPGAKMDVMSTPPPEQLQAWDLLELVNVQRIFENAWKANQAKADELHQKAVALERHRLDGVLASLEEALKSIAAASVGQLGCSLVAKELGDRGGRTCLTRPDDVKALLTNVEKGAKLVAGGAKVKDLVDKLQAEIDKQLKP